MSWIDSRELNERLDELEGIEEDDDQTLDEEDQAELAELRMLRDEVSEFEDGATLIPADDFEDYARELAEDIMPSREARELSEQWPFRHIDWERAADELRADYSEVEYQGKTYLVRSY